MEKILFRCSRLGALMTDPKLKSDKEAGNMSETAKSFIEDKWLEETFGYKEDVITDEMLKGLMCEQDSMQLFQEVTKSGLILKNSKHFTNDYICGTPDIINGEFVDDLKTSYTLKTFFNCEPTKDNIWQIKGYMALTGKKKGRIVYCLVPTPDELITEQKKRFYFKFNCDEQNKHYVEISEQIEKNNQIIKDLPIEKRVKIFVFEHLEYEIQNLYVKIEKAREYYNSLSL